MEKIDFKNLPDTSTPYTAENFNQLQTNVENAINGVAEYSTEETIIGTWLGKPLYRKVIYVSEIDCSTAGFKYVQHGVSNVDIPVKIDYILNAKSNQPTTYNNVITAFAIERASDGVSSSIRFYVGAWDNIKDWYFIFEYTKTTD